MPTIQEQIEQAMAKAFFASAWADMQEEKDADDPTAVNLSGKEIMDVMPDDIDPAALHAARTLVMDMESKNGRPINVLFAQAVVLHDGDREPSAEMFGHYCAMQAMGHGVGLRDAFGTEVRESITVPYVEFGSHSLERDY